MAGKGYSFVPEKGFIAIVRDLSEGAWKDVALKKYDAPDRKLDGKLLMSAPRPVVWKLMLMWAVGDLQLALGMGLAELLDRLDVDWDRVERRFHFAVAGAEEHDDPAHREAAGRVRAMMLMGNGTAQTNLGYDEEVDFGRQQVLLASKAPLSDDIKRLGLGGHVADIDNATEALAAGLGRAPGQKRATARSVRIREALVACSSAFNTVHDEIVWLLAHTVPGETHDLLTALLAPLEALLERYPPPAKQAAAEPPPSTG
jgi:hypothetical protein